MILFGCTCLHLFNVRKIANLRHKVHWLMFYYDDSTKSNIYATFCFSQSILKFQMGT